MFPDKRARWCGGLPVWAACAVAGAIWAQNEVRDRHEVRLEAAHESSARSHALLSLENSSHDINSADLREYVGRLASRTYEGRGTGQKGEQMATAYLAEFFEKLGLQADGDGGGWFQEFPVEIGMEMTDSNTATIELPLHDEPKIVMDLGLEMGKDAQPVGFSSKAKFDSSDLVFGGFGIRTDSYNSYEGMDVKGKWVVVLRAAPSGKGRELSRNGPLLVKARLAKELGAAGILFVKGKTAAVSSELVDLSLPMGGNDLLPSLSITNQVAATLLERVENDEFAAIWDAYDKGSRVKGFELGATIKGEIELKKSVTNGRNTLGRFVVGDKPSKEVVVIGAHVDHLGFGNRGGSRAKGAARTEVHVGADDNASGIAALMEIAQKLSQMKKEGTLKWKRDVIFGAWSGEEMGLFGSKHFVSEWQKEEGEDADKIMAYLNMDMVGRWKENGLILHGVASSTQWESLITGAIGDVDLKMEKKPSPFLPTDMVSFYRGGVPVLAAFTGLHDDYHTPTDTPEKLDYEGMAHIADFMFEMLEATSGDGEALDYVKLDRRGRPIEEEKKGSAGAENPEAETDGNSPPEPGAGRPKAVLGVFFGGADDAGIIIGGISPDSAAAVAGLEEGDVISMLNGKVIASREDLLKILGGMEPGKEYSMEFLREGKKEKGMIKPKAR